MLIHRNHSEEVKGYWSVKSRGLPKIPNLTSCQSCHTWSTRIPSWKERPWLMSKAGRPFPLSFVPFHGLARKSHYTYSFSWDEDPCPGTRLPLWGHYTFYTCILGWSTLVTPSSVLLRMEQRLQGNSFCTRIIQAAYTYITAPPPPRRPHPLGFGMAWSLLLGPLFGGPLLQAEAGVPLQEGEENHK